MLLSRSQNCRCLGCNGLDSLSLKMLFSTYTKSFRLKSDVLKNFKSYFKKKSVEKTVLNFSSCFFFVFIEFITQKLLTFASFGETEHILLFDASHLFGHQKSQRYASPQHLVSFVFFQFYQSPFFKHSILCLKCLKMRL